MPNAKTLVIVESPAKARTIERYLGPGYTVLASYGHVRQLPRKDGSVDVDNDFEPKYEAIPDSKKHIAAIKKALKGADSLLLATDLDREGESIAWHLTELIGKDLGDKQVGRITFGEITKGAIQDAIKDPQQVDRQLVSAQEARQSLDYLYGFTLSPLLWRKIRYGLSAGRVQSVALRLIVEREREIDAFKPKPYWTLDAELKQPKEPDEKLATFKAQLAEDRGNKLKQFDLTDERAKELAEELLKHPVMVESVEEKERKRRPAPPFTTSTLQQEASRKLGFAARRTMRTAQQLYEGIDTGGGDRTGLITYMRTDSVNMANSALAEAREVIGKNYGKEYLPPEPRRYKVKSKGAQEAHEAVRPTSFVRTPDSMAKKLTADQLKLYSLVYKRAMASQMEEAIFLQTSARMKAGQDGEAVLKATGSQVKFPGFIKLYLEGTDDGVGEDTENLLPKLAEGDLLELLKAGSERHETQPPPRFTEATLVKTLEEYGIGRPSTYASIISTLQDRKYARVEQRRFFPEAVGMIVSDLLTNHFSKYVDYQFTSELEDELDEVAEGKEERVPLLKQWWGPFKALVDKKDGELKKEDVAHEKTDKLCPECGKEHGGHLMKKLSRFGGQFYACSRYPECKHTAPLEEEQAETKAAEEQAKDEQCDKCGSPMAVKRGRFGVFFGCTKYPDCKGTKPFVKSTGVKCPECGKGELAERKSKQGRTFYGCTKYPDCKFLVGQKPIKEPCKECGKLVVIKGRDQIPTCVECGWTGEPVTEEATV
ncbi:MAG TPA: type I DNA topoisomerase [Patescibacteria group bacterium]|jgi:DNA topoisomerase-1